MMPATTLYATYAKAHNHRPLEWWLSSGWRLGPNRSLSSNRAHTPPMAFCRIAPATTKDRDFADA
jgi:hypothetical protein